MNYEEITKNMFSSEAISKIIISVAVVTLGLLVIRAVLWMLSIVLKRLHQQHQFIIKKVVFYVLNVLLLVFVLSFVGVDLTAVLGTVGILGIVVGIASQSAIGNIIGGIFLISEGAFQIGDVIKIDAHAGIVHSIDLLAIKLKTFDGVLMRIPNQTLLTSKLVNITKFPIRRLDFDLRVKMDEDLAKVKEILLDIVKTTDKCLNVPEPLFTYKQFGTNGIELLLGVWFEKQNFLVVKNAVYERIQTEFIKNKIEIPYTTVAVKSVSEVHDVEPTNPAG